ncbi:inactive leucine-rich repeat receptor-like protein kinase [Tripterygium wilfordii]|uniref:Inactive leucine-rich repeat receptor-like protein kinase n=1 Tax=Tripterygium wilfordii TaxID=458696 RepID=A0A7J7BX98_TRIWF|nr:inactive leucine-rich repeat receptor-like protein kinase [Tripterygium wilfordii]
MSIVCVDVSKACLLWVCDSKLRIVAIFAGASVWLLLSCSLSYGVESDINCLRSIKETLQDPRKVLNISWNFENNTEGSICGFIGVECWHPDESKVLNIRLSDMGLKGSFPLGIQNCTSLTGLDLSSNELYGSIPSNISKIIGFVTTLDLSSNSFSGEIPENLANCSYLNVLKLDHNNFSGQIPLQLGLLGRIKEFSVANNLLSGPVPNFINASNLITADSYANNLGLCGKPLRPCTSASKSSNTGIIAGAAIGGVTIAAIGIGIGMLFYFRKASMMKKKDDDPEGNKWARSLKGTKGIKAS